MNMLSRKFMTEEERRLFRTVHVTQSSAKTNCAFLTMLVQCQMFIERYSFRDSNNLCYISLILNSVSLLILDLPFFHLIFYVFFIFINYNRYPECRFCFFIHLNYQNTCYTPNGNVLHFYWVTVSTNMYCITNSRQNYAKVKQRFLYSQQKYQVSWMPTFSHVHCADIFEDLNRIFFSIDISMLKLQV